MTDCLKFPLSILLIALQVVLCDSDGDYDPMRHALYHLHVEHIHPALGRYNHICFDYLIRDPNVKIPKKFCSIYR